MAEGDGGWLAPGSDKPHRPGRWLANSQPCLSGRADKRRGRASWSLGHL